MNSKTPELSKTSAEMERLYERLHFVSDQGCGMATGDWPLINIYKVTDGAIVEAIIPGIELSDLKLSVREKVLTIDKNVVPCAVRRPNRIFFRTIEFPFAIDVANSTFHTFNGLLRVKLSRRKNEERLNEKLDGSEMHSKGVALNPPIGIASASPKLIPVLSKPSNREPANASGDMLIPKTDIVETEESYLMVVELPGIPCYALEITLDGSVLTIEARKPQFLFQEDHLVYSEFETVGYRRRLSLFQDVNSEGITALLKNGTLRMRLPKNTQHHEHAWNHATKCGGA